MKLELVTCFVFSPHRPQEMSQNRHLIDDQLGTRDVLAVCVGEEHVNFSSGCRKGVIGSHGFTFCRADFRSAQVALNLCFTCFGLQWVFLINVGLSPTELMPTTIRLLSSVAYSICESCWTHWLRQLLGDVKRNILIISKLVFQLKFFFSGGSEAARASSKDLLLKERRCSGNKAFLEALTDFVELRVCFWSLSDSLTVGGGRNIKIHHLQLVPKLLLGYESSPISLQKTNPGTKAFKF